MSAASFADYAFDSSVSDPIEADDAKKPLHDALSTLARYIPAEGLALYVAVGAFASTLPGLVIVGLASAIVLTGLIVFLKWRDARYTQGESKPSRWRLVLLMSVILATLLIYVSALPGNPITSGIESGTIIGGVATIVAASFLTVLGPRLKIEPSPGGGKPEEVLGGPGKGKNGE